jgi:hypothetical protein
MWLAVVKCMRLWLGVATCGGVKRDVMGFGFDPSFLISDSQYQSLSLANNFDSNI